MRCRLGVRQEKPGEIGNDISERTWAGALAAAHSGSLAIDAARFRALAQRSFYIVIQFSGEEATIAGGLTAVTATGLVADINRAVREELR